MPMLRQDWTASDLLDLPDDGNRYEILDGELLVTPAPSLAHQRAAGLLYRLLAEYLVAQPVGEPFIAPADVRFSNRRVLQPDIFVIPLVGGRRAAKFEDVGRLMLAVEVLSASTARADRVAKRRVFREEGVPEYWVVDLDARTIERSTPADERLDVFADSIAWFPEGATAPLRVQLAEYFGAVLD